MLNRINAGILLTFIKTSEVFRMKPSSFYVCNVALFCSVSKPHLVSNATNAIGFDEGFYCRLWDWRNLRGVVLFNKTGGSRDTKRDTVTAKALGGCVILIKKFKDLKRDIKKKLYTVWELFPYRSGYIVYMCTWTDIPTQSLFPFVSLATRETSLP